MSNTVSREPRRDRQFWLDHVQRWKYSGLSKAAYCEKHKLKAGSFYNWSRKNSASKIPILSNDQDPNAGKRQSYRAPHVSTCPYFMFHGMSASIASSVSAVAIRSMTYYR
ncbi:IS66 family insertion sequence element accessory protein TnpA [Granulosicoccus antarcticus]|uniref:IS66 family insertion sequence element accessory protein TnpA n=1 Tax=Granulosicoccus antarcticus TaxID=437505 RepID=UPI0012FE0A63|nr:hypothetical protein [Granulosicoccus antarcticus]